MKIEKIMTKNVKTCREQDGMDVAARIMWEADCGIVPVIGEDERLVGVITDRDACMASWLRGLPLSGMKVREAMTRSPHACTPDDPVEVAADLMREYRIRRVPVIVDDGRVVGIVSVNDLARTARSQPRAVPVDGLVSTLATICQPHGSAPAQLVPTASHG